MKKQVLKNPRARRMLDLIPLDNNEGNSLSGDQTSDSHSAKTSFIQIDVNKTQPNDQRENHSSEYHISTSLVKAGDIDQELVTPSAIQRSTKVKQSYDLRDLKIKYYDERDKENEDYSTDASSEYLPSPNREIQTPSSTSSFGGDSACIEKLIETNNKLWSPSVISNISFVLDNDVDFVASPTAIYKFGSVGASKVILEQPTDKYGNLVTLNRSKAPSLTPSCEKHQVEENSGDETLKSNNGDNTLNPNETFVENSPSIDITAVDENLHILQRIEMDQTSVSTIVNKSELSNCQDIEIGQEVPQINDTYMVQSNELSSSDQENLPTGSVPNNEQFEPSVTQQSQINKLTRKRTCNMDEWKDKKNKAMKNSGKSYDGVRTKKTFDEKKIGPVPLP